MMIIKQTCNIITDSNHLRYLSAAFIHYLHSHSANNSCTIM